MGPNVRRVADGFTQPHRAPRVKPSDRERLLRVERGCRLLLLRTIATASPPKSNPVERRRGTSADRWATFRSHGPQRGVRWQRSALPPRSGSQQPDPGSTGRTRQQAGRAQFRAGSAARTTSADAPAPRFYVEEQATFGYFQSGPQPRGLRFAVDLETGDVFGVQWTRGGTPDAWRTPTQPTSASVLAAIREVALCDLAGALAGESRTRAAPRCFRFDEPRWSDGLRFPREADLRSSRTRRAVSLA